MSCANTPDTATKYARVSACSPCNYGAIVPRWLNLTAVRQAGDTGATPTYTPPPYSRASQWLNGADYDGLSAQVYPTVDDIGACAAPDSLHYTLDHNCYAKLTKVATAIVSGDLCQIVTVGTTDFTLIGAASNTVGVVFTATGAGTGTGTALMVVNMVMPKRFGGQWSFSQKYWDGRYGFAELDCLGVSSLNVAAAADGLHYLAKTVNAQGGFSFSETQSNIVGAPSGFTSTLAYVVTLDYEWTITVNRYSGVRVLTSYVNKLTITGTATGIYNSGTSAYNATGTIAFSGSFVNGTPGTLMMSLNGGAPVGQNAGSITYVSGSDSWSPVVNNVDPFYIFWDRSGGFNNSFVDLAREFDCCNSTVIGLWPYLLSPTPASGSVTDWNTSLSALTAWPGYSLGTPGTATGSATVTNTQFELKASGSSAQTQSPTATPCDDITTSFSFDYKATLSVPYYGSDCTNDMFAAMAYYDSSNFNLSDLREDENLAHGLLCTYSEIQSPIAPTFDAGWMDDYSQNPFTVNAGSFVVGGSYRISSVGTTTNWNAIGAKGLINEIFTATGAGSGDGAAVIQMPWLDPAAYDWQTQALPNHGQYFTAGSLPSGFTGGATLIQNARFDGSVKGVNLSGSDRHFWFGCPNYTFGGGVYTVSSYGNVSDSQMQPCATRWQAVYDEKYDASMNTPWVGNFPQQFTDFQNGRIKGGKYVQAITKWNAVDFLQPCAARKFDVDQTTVCAVTNATGFNYTTGGVLIITPTTGATAPSSGYVIVEGTPTPSSGGVYPVVTLVGTTLTVGAKIDGLPTSYVFSDPAQYSDGYVHVGKLRWIGYGQYGTTFSSAPGIRGRVAITTGYSGGILTVTTSAAQPYFRVDPASVALRAVNLYDSTGTLLNGSPLVLARTDDSHFTATTTNYPAAVWMTDAALTWAQSGFTNASQNTGVLIQWGFDQRQAALPTASQPPWVGGNGTAGSGIQGCLDSAYAISQFNYPGGACPAIVGIVPTGSPENFQTQMLFGFPATPVDGVYGAHSQSYIQLSMPDPYAQTPFTPIGVTSWREDDGSGQADAFPTCYYAAAPLVEALETVPAGKYLVTGISLYFDPSNHHSPPNYPFGVPLGNNVATDFGFVERACANILASGRFSAGYATWVAC